MNFFKQLAISIYQFDRYKELISLRARSVVFYEVILFLFSTIISILPLGIVYAVNGGTDGLIREYVPDFKIEDGKLHIDNAEASVFDDGSSLIIIDANNSRSEFDLQGTTQGIIFDNEKMIIKNGVSVVNYSYSELLGKLGIDKFEKNDIYNYTGYINMLLVIFIGIAVVMLIISEAIGIFVLSLIGAIIAKITSARLKFPQLLRLSVYSRTLAVILTTVLGVFGLNLGFIFIIILDIAYLYFGIKKCEINIK